MWENGLCRHKKIFTGRIRIRKTVYCQEVKRNNMECILTPRCSTLDRLTGTDRTGHYRTSCAKINKQYGTVQGYVQGVYTRAGTIHLLPIRFDFDTKGDDSIYIAIFNYPAIRFDISIYCDFFPPQVSFLYTRTF